MGIRERWQWRDSNSFDQRIMELILGKRDTMIDKFTSTYVDRSIAH